MSVRKVKISELPQLPQESDASGIFMPAADENNHSYRVPLSRYDNAKGEAEAATAAAQSAAKEAGDAAKAANAAADRANGVSDNSTANAALELAKAANIAANRLAFSPLGTVEGVRGTVLGIPAGLRLAPRNYGYGNVAYPTAGYGCTFDIKAPTLGNMLDIIKDAASRGDVTVALSGKYTFGWLGTGKETYQLAYIDVHKTRDFTNGTNVIAVRAFDSVGPKQFCAFIDEDSTGIVWFPINTTSGEAGGVLTGSYPNPSLVDNPTCRTTDGWVPDNPDETPGANPSKVVTADTLAYYAESFVARELYKYTIPVFLDLPDIQFCIPVCGTRINNVPYQTTRAMYIMSPSAPDSNPFIILPFVNVIIGSSISMTIAIKGEHLADRKLKIEAYEGNTLDSKKLSVKIRASNDALFAAGKRTYGESLTYRTAVHMANLIGDTDYTVANKVLTLSISVIRINAPNVNTVEIIVNVFPVVA